MSPTSVATKSRTPSTIGKGESLLDVKDFFKGDALADALKKTDQRKKMISALSHFVDQDAFSTLNMVSAGEIYHNFLLQPLQLQKQFLTVMAEELGVTPPVYAADNQEKRSQGRQETGRSQLAAILYAAHPEMLEIKPGQRDTLAGKRVSACLRAYRLSAGLIQRRQLDPGQQPAPRTAPQLWPTLLSYVENEEEQEILIEIMHRAGITDEILGRWGRGVVVGQGLLPEEEEAAQPQRGRGGRAAIAAVPPPRQRGGGRRAA